VDETEVKFCKEILQFVSVSHTSGPELASTPIEGLKSFGIDVTYL
jgi:hypothetical protein